MNETINTKNMSNEEFIRRVDITVLRKKMDENYNTIKQLRARIAELESSQKIRDDVTNELEHALSRYMAKFGDCGDCYEKADLILKKLRDLLPMPEDDK